MAIGCPHGGGGAQRLDSDGLAAPALEVAGRRGRCAGRAGLLGGGGELASGMEVAIDPQVYTPDPGALGLPFTTVQVRGELGEMPAWKVAGRADTWAIVVHGINSTPQTGLRLLPALSHSGMPTLLITYREDLGAPASPDGLRHMGQTEWRDLQAAVRYALSHGAEHVVLAGYSMGGSIVAQFMQNSELASPQVVGLVLDAPALDWRKTIKFNATEMGSPAFSTLSVEWAIGARIDVDWNDLDAAGHPEDFQLPILLFHGTEDDIVPISISNEFAEELPRRVTYYRIPHADHTEAWNVDPELYERRLEAFLLKLDASDPVSRRRGGQSGGPR